MWTLILLLNINGQQIYTQRVLPDKSTCRQQMLLINNAVTQPNNLNLVASCVPSK